jgi:hypothetical protein
MLKGLRQSNKLHRKHPASMKTLLHALALDAGPGANGSSFWVED